MTKRWHSSGGTLKTKERTYRYRQHFPSYSPWSVHQVVWDGSAIQAQWTTPALASPSVVDQKIAAFRTAVNKEHKITFVRMLKLVCIYTYLNNKKKRYRGQGTRQRVSTYLYDLAYENRRVVGRLNEDSPRDDFTVVEGLSTQSCFSQAACIDQLVHLKRDHKEQWIVLFLTSILSKSCAMPYRLDFFSSLTLRRPI